MKIAELKPGKKYYHTFATNMKSSGSGIRKRETSIIRVIQIDLSGMRVLASINCFPAQWYDETTYKYWLEENPLVIKTVNPLS